MLLPAFACSTTTVALHCMSVYSPCLADTFWYTKILHKTCLPVPHHTIHHIISDPLFSLLSFPFSLHKAYKNSNSNEAKAQNPTCNVSYLLLTTLHSTHCKKGLRTHSLLETRVYNIQQPMQHNIQNFNLVAWYAYDDARYDGIVILYTDLVY